MIRFVAYTKIQISMAFSVETLHQNLGDYRLNDIRVKTLKLFFSNVKT